MRVAALYDIHGNLPALEAVADDIRSTGVDQIVIGGDVLPGPMPVETLDFLSSLAIPIQFIHGNGELAVLAQLSASDDPATVKYWGTRTGEPLPEAGRAVVRWTAQQLSQEMAERVSRWPKTLTLNVKTLGRVLFCHGTPRSEIEVFTRLTPEVRLTPIFEGVDAQLVVCGHTHMQFDRMVGAMRVVNAGSVGMPFEQPPAAYWLLLGPEVQLHRTLYDLARAADRVRVTAYPQAGEFADRNILNPPDLLEAITTVSL
jgi:predicted phosphodiesterase